MFSKVSIVIPVYNEEKTVEKILKRVKEADVLGLEKEIVCVNDCSRDNSKKVLEELQKELEIKEPEKQEEVVQEKKPEIISDKNTWLPKRIP